MKTPEKLRISLKAARVNADMTQKEAAERLGVCVSTLQHYETGDTIPDWDMVRRIEEVYGLSADHIFFDRNSA